MPITRSNAKTAGGSRARLLRLRIASFATLAVIGLSSCGVTYHATLPEVPHQSVPVTAQGVGLAKVKDARANGNVGYLGAGGSVTMTSGAELPDYIFEYTSGQLAAQGFKAVVTPDPTDPAYSSNRFKGNTVLLTLQSVNVTMTDTLLTPGRSNAAILIQIYDSDGRQIYSQQTSGSYSESFPLFSGAETASKMTGKLAAEACNRAVLATLTDPHFIHALRATQAPSSTSQSASK